ncbi:MAG: hypothetical protein F6K31_27885 [Symploca sp. SIO2G7]|nr:hypothetical protein [Symploca sp. SIO2G7]
MVGGRWQVVREEVEGKRAPLKALNFNRQKPRSIPVRLETGLMVVRILQHKVNNL